MDIHKTFNNKMRKYRPLMLHPDVMAYIPETSWYSEEAVVNMLERYSTLFIKPNKGRIGIGVMRLRKHSGQEFEVHYLEKATVVPSLKEALQVVEQNMNPKKKYLVQQGIDLATVLDRPFDMRVVMHKVDGEWSRSAWCAKVSPPKLVVTNNARGGVILTVEQALEQNKGLFDPKATIARIEEICYQICKVYDLHFSFAIIGLDMAVDKNGQIWFIEANTQPDHRMFMKLGDPRIYKRLKRKDRRIKRKSRRLIAEQKNSHIQTDSLEAIHDHTDEAIQD